MAVALILTAFGGFYMATFPDYYSLRWLFGYYGFTTIFLFWAPMIKATRVWGGESKQGLAFGFLDGGRGLVAASFGSIGLFIFAYFLKTEISESTFLQRKEAFHYVILMSSLAILMIGVMVYLLLKPLHPEISKVKSSNKIYSFENFKTVLKYPSVWLMMTIILCAYFGYKVTDIFSLYAKDVLRYDDFQSAKVGTSLLYIRPIAGIGIGLLADKTRASLWIIIGFLLMLITSIIFASGMISEQTIFLFLFSIICMAVGVYSARVLYFALMQEAQLPLAITGTAIGFISVIGYTPDIFAGPLIGILLDTSPGELGHQQVFMVMCGFSFIGLIASVVFYNLAKQKRSDY
jgi:Na+/melibiose symporter-like transporter